MRALLLPRLAFLLAFLLGVASPAIAQDSAASEAATDRVSATDPAVASPRDTLETFLAAMAQEPPDFERALGCMELQGVARDAADDLAVKLHRIINRIEWIDLSFDASIPGPTEAAGSEAGAIWRFFPREARPRSAVGVDLGVWLANRERREQVRSLAPAARIELVRGEEEAWRFSAATVAGVESLWPRLRDLEPVLMAAGTERLTVAERIRQWFPASMRSGGVLGIEPWQWASIAILVFVGLAVDLVVRLLLAAATLRIVRRRGGEVERPALRRAVRPFGMAAGAILWLGAVSLLGLPNQALLVLGPAVRLYAMLAFVWAAFRVTDLVGEYFLARARRTDNRFDDLVVPLLRKTAKILVGIFGLISIASSFDIQLAPLLTGLGIGGVGFAFAAKDTLENLFGSVTVILDRPFQVGDWVVIGETEGTVEELGLRSVRVRTFYNSLVTIPTANLVRARIDNYGVRKYRRWKTHLNLLYETPPDLVEAYCEGIRELIRSHPYTRKDYFQVWLHQFGPHSIDVLVYMFFETPEWSTELRERHRLMLDVMRLADRLGVQFAYPTQRLVLEPGQPPEPPPPAADPAAAASPPEIGHDVLARRHGRVVAREMTRQERWRRRVPPPHHFSADVEDEEPDEDGPPPTGRVPHRRRCRVSRRDLQAAAATIEA